MSRFFTSSALAACLFWLLLNAPVSAGEKDVVEYRHVETLLRRHCYRCHNDSKQEGGLNLTRRQAVFGQADSLESIVVPGKPKASLLIARVSDHDYGDIMPLDAAALKPQQIQTLSDWIATGATWPESAEPAIHWAYQPVSRPKVPETESSGNAIDAFIQQKLTAVNLQPSSQLPPALWLRRVSLALTGLPPTLEELNQFENDSSAEARERAVDRLLSSPRFGERWAVPWLDLARYADSNGFQADQLRDSWAFRDWVIKSMNADQPFDQFVIEQLAGDMLPEATVEQKIATGFHRTVTCNVEAGVHPEQNRVNQVFDRVNTTGTAFLGTTLECAQCHDHKYDPIDQEDYYRLFACFNNTPLEVKNTAGVTWDFYGPAMDLPLPAEKERTRRQLQRQIAAFEQERDELKQKQLAGYQSWLDSLAAAPEESLWQPLIPEHVSTEGQEQIRVLDDGSVLLTGPVPDKALYTALLPLPAGTITAIKLETLTHDELPGRGPGRGDPVRTNFVLHNFQATQRFGNEPDQPVPFLRAFADFSQSRWDVSGLIDNDPKSGWAIAPQFSQDHWAVLVLSQPLQSNGSTSLEVTLDQHFGSGRNIGRFRLSAFLGSPEQLELPEEIRQLAQTKDRNKKQEDELRDFYLSQDSDLARLDKRIQQVEKQLKAVQPDTTLVMVEMDEPRQTHILERGEYLHPAESVEPGLPKIFGNPDALNPPNRLGLARWIASEQNPLLARVTVNRWWTELFGQGLVKTLEDFGTQGEPPTHPELLDWLAAELMENGWSRKQLLKTIVLSDAFGQSAAATPELLKRDPANELFARGPRFRMKAEMVRDNALAISGLLSDKMHGPPVMPYQPDGLWRSIGRNQPKWKMETDEDRFRRGIYIIWKRDAPYPSLMNFDAPDRTACVAQRPRTNTPLQALTLLNDPAFGEMSLGLAVRMLQADGSSDETRLREGFRLCTSREPVERELHVLQRLLTQERQLVASQPELIKQRMSLKQPGFPLNWDNDRELAIWFAIANALLNLDETMTQG
ncbi:MAG: hypothetical protein CMJ47_09250 [Planctomyces sp.]|nr:hypothetical protein [Planctomyces sp.]